MYQWKFPAHPEIEGKLTLQILRPVSFTTCQFPSSAKMATLVSTENILSITSEHVFWLKSSRCHLQITSEYKWLEGVYQNVQVVILYVSWKNM